MALPTAYLTSVKNLGGILNAMRSAQAPDKFTQKFLEDLGFKSNSDRLIINMLKALGFVDDAGRPTKRYFAFLDQSQSAKVLAEGVRDAYADLFRVNVNAQTMTKVDVVNKLKTLSEGKISQSVADKMAMTFLALAKVADFKAPTSGVSEIPVALHTETKPTTGEVSRPDESGVSFGSLVYTIQIILPESRDQAVYDAIFSSLRTHLK